jgi:chromosome segregation protein
LFLKRIELNGFKSFPDKYEILMDDKITGIVGPNGSGKSNIADAIRWVLGEQSAKSLRGEKMEDVIFNGTQLRKQKAYCEVSLIFNNESGRLSTDYLEIQITRKMYRSGESEYYINNGNCRLKDILDLFRDTGIGKEGYSIIGQGKIDEILNEKAISRRKVFEEAAGIMKYRTRKEESERKLARTEDNLTRVRDIIDELEYQIEPLQAQCEDAKRYLQLKEKQKELEVNVFLNTYEHGKERIEKLKKELKGLDEENEQKTFELQGLKKNETLDDDTIDRLDGDLLHINYTISTNLAAIERLEGEARLQAEKKKHIYDEIQRLNDEVNTGNITALGIEKQITQTGQEIETLQEEIFKKETQENSVNGTIASIARDVGESDNAGGQGALKELQAELSNMKSLLSSLEAKKDSCQAKIDDLSIQRLKAEDELAGIRNESTEIEKSLEKSSKEKASLLAAVNENTAKAKENEAQIKRHMEERAALQRRADVLSSKIKTLQDMRENHEGYYDSVKALLAAADHNESLKHKIIGPVAARIQVPEKYEAAIEAVLGASLQNIIVHDEYDAKALIEYLRANTLGKATFLPLKALRVRTLAREEKAQLNIKGVLGIASDIVKTDNEAKTAIDYLLARTVIVEDMDCAITLMRASGYVFRTVTLLGDVLSPGGVITGGGGRQKGLGLISRDRILENARQEHAEILKDIEKTDIAGPEKKQQALSAEIQRLLDDLHHKDLLCASLNEKKTSNNNRSADMQERLTETQSQAKNAENELSLIMENINAGKIKQDELHAKLNEKEKLLLDHEQRQSMLSEKTLGLNEQLKKIQIELATLRAQKEGKEAEYKRLILDLNTLHNEIKQKDYLIVNSKSEALQIESLVEQIQKSLAAERALSGQLDLKLKETAQRKEEAQIKIKSKSHEKQSLQDTLNGLLEKRLRYEMQIGKLETDVETAQNRLWEEYRLTYLNAVELRGKINMISAQQEIEKIKEEIRGMGNINPNAVEDFQRVMDRRNFLAGQRSDLEKAIDDLKKVIDELMHNMRASFKDRFSIINEYFKESFGELFGGGKAELLLQNEDDIMECGIDIIAEPPGKRLQNISLLSGGEKSMTAIALLFAMQRLNPSPVCLLDEIDAALDDANLSRFSEYIKSYTSKVQFVVITHRKTTMAICDTLYGIAMEEKGVSKMLSVKLA